MFSRSPYNANLPEKVPNLDIESTAGVIPPELSVVIPAFNEERVLGKCLELVERYVRARDFTFEILVVDDGSTDRTREVAGEYSARSDHVRLLANDRNRGKGFAVRQGMLAARGKQILFMDADLSTAPEEFDRMKDWFDRGYAIVIGTRRSAGATIDRHQSFVRETMGKIFTAISRIILRTSVSDFTCGFKAFSHAAAQSVFSRQRLNDWSFDAEVLHIAQRRGIPIKEIPVHWADTEDSKVHIVQDTFRSLLGLLRILLNSILGKYDGLSAVADFQRQRPRP